MPNGDNVVAQTFYLAQLQACKGSCKCKVCELLRKSADQMVDTMLAGKDTGALGTAELVQELTSKGYQVIEPEAAEERR